MFQKRLSLPWNGDDIETLFGCEYKDVPERFAIDGGHKSFASLSGCQCANVIGACALQKRDTVSAGHFQLSPARQRQPAALLGQSKIMRVVIHRLVCCGLTNSTAQSRRPTYALAVRTNARCASCNKMKDSCPVHRR